jgi:excisionase family DNA binding protein
MTKLLTVQDLSARLKLHPQTIYKLVEQGEIPYIKRTGIRIRFREEQIEEWLKQGSSKLSQLGEIIQKFDLDLDRYDRLFLKGGVKVSPKGKTWNYPWGSVFLRPIKSGMERWYIYYRVKGKRVRECVRHAQCRADAVKALSLKVADAFRSEHGIKAPGEKEVISFEDFGKEFLELYSRVHWSPKTVRGHENSLRHINRFFRGKRLSEIVPEQVARYIAERKAKVSVASINRELSCLKCVLNRAVEWGRLESNPIVRMKKFKEPEPKDRILSGEEIRRLLAACAPHLRPIVLTALCTGLRRSEILTLPWRQVDLGKKTVRVERTKSGKDRIVFINSLLLRELQSLRTASGQAEYVFLGPNRKAMKDVKTAFKAACRRAGIRSLRFHDLRHNAASKMVEAGIDLVTVSKILGHASIQTTMRYAHPTPENMRRAVETLAQNVVSAQDFVPAPSPRKEGVPVNDFISAN